MIEESSPRDEKILQNDNRLNYQIKNKFEQIKQNSTDFRVILLKFLLKYTKSLITSLNYASSLSYEPAPNRT